MILWHLLPGATPISLLFVLPSGVADLLRYGGLLCSGRPADLLRNTGRFTPEHAGLGTLPVLLEQSEEAGFTDT